MVPLNRVVKLAANQVVPRHIHEGRAAGAEGRGVCEEGEAEVPFEEAAEISGGDD